MATIIRRRNRSFAGLVAGAMLCAACSSSHQTAAGPTTTTTAPTVISSTTAAAVASTTPTALPTTTTARTTTIASTATPPDTCARGSSPANYDPQQGKYAVRLTKIDGTARTIGFDPIQFLVGQPAITAYRHDNPGATDTPPNDYYIVNASSQVYSAHVASNVVVWQVRLAEGGTNLKPGTFARLVSYLAAHKTNSSSLLAYNPYWLTLANGEVTVICEQFVP